MSSVTMERLEFLLAMRASDELTGEEEREVAELLERHPLVDEDGYDLAAAAILADSVPAQPMPQELRAKLVHQGQALVAAADSTSVESAAAGPNRVVSLAERRPSRTALTGWLAAAACLALAVTAWWPRLTGPLDGTQAVDVDSVTAPPTVDEQRTELMSAADAQVLAWSATEDPSATGATGDVVWSPSRQQGYMRISRLEANEPTTAQYQLWIFDRQRDERYPVDGGVFDMPAGVTEAVVPIDAKVFVDEPYLFAVTVEPPGGVVVSDRERIVLVAQPAAV